MTNLTLISTAVPGAVLHYGTATALRADVVNARIWLGIHFRFADTAAGTVGTRIADWTLDRHFKRVPHDHD